MYVCKIYLFIVFKYKHKLWDYIVHAPGSGLRAPDSGMTAADDCGEKSSYHSLLCLSSFVAVYIPARTRIESHIVCVYCRT